MNNNEEESKLLINTTFILDDDVELTIKNINVETLSRLTKDVIIDVIMFKWYMYKVYDIVDILSEEYVIVVKTKKKIELVRYNTKKKKVD